MKKRAKPMLPLQVDGVEYKCSCADYWPPIEVEVYGGSAQDLRHTVPDLVYQRIRTWEGACGLFSMSAEKCPQCPYVQVNGEPPRAFASPSVKIVKNDAVIRESLRQKHRPR